MFVDESINNNLAKDFWQGKPSGSLLWCLDAGYDISNIVQNAGYDNTTKFMQKELGNLIWGTGVDPCKLINGCEIKEQYHPDDTLQRQFICDAGVLTEIQKHGQITKHKVATAEDLKILIQIWEQSKVEPNLEYFCNIKENDKGRWPVFVTANMASAVQHLIQNETGVENFWYLLMDCPLLVEQSMDMWQSLLCSKYKIMQMLESDGFYQGENTSTTLISPQYYRKYSLGHIRQFTLAAEYAGVRSLVHMCGLIYDLMADFKDAKINGIHALSPPDIGNTPFEYAYEVMPEGFFSLGRLGSLNWIGKTEEQIIDCLLKILPHHIYREKAFVLLVTADGAHFTLDNLRVVRDAINKYESLSF